VRWYYYDQFLTLALCGLMTPILLVAVIINGLGGRTFAELREHQEKLFHVLGLFGLIALSFLVAGFVFAISTWVLWVDHASEQVRGRAWAILGCFLIALLYIALSLYSQRQIYWAVPTIELTGMLVFWRARGPLWKFRGKGIHKLAKKRGGLLRFVFRRYSAPA
jgi:cytochrome bd-type quinol oxidase subunit 2